VDIEQIFKVEAKAGKYVIDGEVAPVLELVKGKSYQFDLSDSSLSTHPFEFKIDGDAWDNTYSKTGTLGVDQILTFQVPLNSSGTISYYCERHPGMGNTISFLEALNTLNVLGPHRGVDAENLDKIFTAFTEQTGINIEYIGSPNFNQELIENFANDKLPDIAIIPQPGLLRDLVRVNAIAPLDAETVQWVEDNYAAGASWNNLVTVEKNDITSVYGFFFNTNMKSLIWYSPERFKDLDLQVPSSFEELYELTSDLANRGLTPWAMPFGSAGATGWPGTDWVEDLVMLQNGAAVYDYWITGEQTFSSTEIQDALNTFSDFATLSGYDSDPTILSKYNFWDGISMIAKSDTDQSAPLLLHSASFMEGFASDELDFGTDYDYFEFPDSASSEPFMRVGGTSWSVMNTNGQSEAKQLIKFLQSSEVQQIWLEKGGFLTPMQIPETILETLEPATKKLQKSFQELEHTNIVFDGSDMMPSEIGTGLFWTEMTSFFETTPEQIGKTIDTAWPNFLTYEGVTSILHIGGDEDDELNATELNDIVFGGNGADLISSSDGNDTIIVGSEDKFSHGMFAKNVASISQVGTDQKISIKGMLKVEDVIDGGGDVDTIRFGDGNIALFLHDAFSSFHSSTSLSVDSTGKLNISRLKNVEQIIGNDSDLNLIDLTSPDYSLVGQAIKISGGDGVDIIWGSDADENIRGGSGNDVLFGGSGTNILTGGLGADEFQFTKTSTKDRVEDFSIDEGDTLKFFNKGGARFDKTSAALENGNLIIKYGSNVQDQLTVYVGNEDLTISDISDAIIIV